MTNTGTRTHCLTTCRSPGGRNGTRGERWARRRAGGTPRGRASTRTQRDRRGAGDARLTHARGGSSLHQARAQLDPAGTCGEAITTDLGPHPAPTNRTGPRASPPRSALTADSTESTHTSIRKPSSMPRKERRDRPGSAHGGPQVPRSLPSSFPPASASGPAPRAQHPASPPRGPEPAPFVSGPGREGARPTRSVRAEPRPPPPQPRPRPGPGPRPRLSRAFTCAGGARGSLLVLGHVPRNCHGDARRWPEALTPLPPRGRHFRARSGCCGRCAAEAGGSSVSGPRSSLSVSLRVAASRSSRPPPSRPLSGDGCSPAAALWRVL